MEPLLITDAEISILSKLYEKWKKTSESDKQHEYLKAVEMSFTICSVLPRLLDQIKILREHHAKNNN